MPNSCAMEEPYRCRGSLTTFILCVAIIDSAFGLGMYAAFGKPFASARELFHLAWPSLLLWVLAIFCLYTDRHYSVAILQDGLLIRSLGWRGLVTKEIAFKEIASFKVGESRFGPVLVMELGNGRKLRTRAGLKDFAGMCKKLEVQSGKTGILPPWIPA